MKDEDLIEKKKEIKKKKPNFRRVEAHRFKSLPDNWRKPKGHHSKVRRKERGHVRMPDSGMRTPVKLRHTDKEGRKIIRIKNVKDLQLLDEDSVGVVAKNLGLRRKAIIAEEVKKMQKSMHFINFNPEQVLEEVKRKLESAKKKRKMKKKEREEIKKKAKKPKKPKKKPKKPVKKPKKSKKASKKVKKKGKKKSKKSRKSKKSKKGKNKKGKKSKKSKKGGKK